MTDFEHILGNARFFTTAATPVREALSPRTWRAVSGNEINLRELGEVPGNATFLEHHRVTDDNRSRRTLILNDQRQICAFVIHDNDNYSRMFVRNASEVTGGIPAFTLSDRPAFTPTENVLVRRPEEVRAVGNNGRNGPVVLGITGANINIPLGNQNGTDTTVFDVYGGAATVNTVRYTSGQSLHVSMFNVGGAAETGRNPNPSVTIQLTPPEGVALPQPPAPAPRAPGGPTL